MKMNDRYLFKANRVDNGEWVQGYLVYDNRDEMYRIIIEIHYSTGTCITTDNAPRVVHPLSADAQARKTRTVI